MPIQLNTPGWRIQRAGGTRGASMVAGADTVKIHGELVPVRAQVLEIDNLSAHADSNEMLSWLAHFKMPPKKLFITHGEPEAAYRRVKAS